MFLKKPSSVVVTLAVTFSISNLQALPINFCLILVNNSEFVINGISEDILKATGYRPAPARFYVLV